MSGTPVLFYEKPGCVSNDRQKALLQEKGHFLEVRDLLSEPWTPESLRPFFGERPINEWFNPTAPRIKSGELVPTRLDEATALARMVEDPLLIRRPLMDTVAGFSCGFEPGPVLDYLGVAFEPGQDLQSCSKPGSNQRCEPPGDA